MDSGGSVLKSYCWAVAIFAASSAAVAEDSRIPRHFLWESNDQVLENPHDSQECLRVADSNQITLGRIAFNSPRLLGGQAGRMGLSCNGCHVAGRDNPRFIIEQISSQPGTVDLTNAFFSSRGGDRIFNPRLIPDLSKREGLKFTARKGHVFEQHINTLIQTEFDGQSPPKTIMAALLLYLDALDSANCNHTRVPNSLAGHEKLLHETLGQIEAGMTSQDLELTKFLIKTFRAELETVYLFSGKVPDEGIDSRLLALSREAELLLNELSLDADKTVSLESLKKDLNGIFQSIERNLKLTYFIEPSG